jgi:hypothetical protein
MKPWTSIACATVIAGCGYINDGSDCTPRGGQRATTTYVVNALTLPTTSSMFAIDLSGGNNPTSALGALVGELSAHGIDAQSAVTAAIPGSPRLNLVTVAPTPPALSDDRCALAQFPVGKAEPGGRYVIDPNATASAFYAPLQAGSFDSTLPAKRSMSLALQLELPLFSGATPLEVPLEASHLQLTADPQVVHGQIQGAVRLTDMLSSVLPQLVTLLNGAINAAPTSAQAMQILGSFDNGGTAAPACAGACKNADGSCAKANDGRIAPCELSTSSLLAPAFTPDVQLFGLTGSFEPNPSGVAKDSISVALAFTGGVQP